MEASRPLDNERSHETLEAAQKDITNPKSDESIVKRAVNDETTNADAIFQSAIRGMQFDNLMCMSEPSNAYSSTGVSSERRTSDLDDNRIEVDLSTEIEIPPRKVRRKIYRFQQEERRSSENLISEEHLSTRDTYSENVTQGEFEMCPDESNSFSSSSVPSSNIFLKLENKSSKVGTTVRKWSSTENLISKNEKSLLDQELQIESNLNSSIVKHNDSRFSEKSCNTRSVEDVRTNRCSESLLAETTQSIRALDDLLINKSSNISTSLVDSRKKITRNAPGEKFVIGSTHDQSPKKVSLGGKGAKNKDKTKMSSLKSSLGRKVGSVERMLEDRMEKIWEENVEKHPWLLPIETWIADRYRSERRSTDTEEKRSGSIERSLNFKFTAAEKEEDEPKVESRIVEHLRRLRGSGSPKPQRSESDASHLSQKLKKPTSLTPCTNDSEESVNSLIEKEGILEMKDVKHSNHDLFDKLKDNVKVKIEDIHRYFQRTNRLADVNRRLKSQIWSSVVTIVLVEAKNLLPMDIDGLSDPYVKFRLGTEKYKSKVVNKTLNPVWLEQFDLHLYEDPYLGQELEVTVWDRDRSHQDDLMGRTVIDLATLERETTHRLWRDLEDGAGSIFLLLTISGTTASETISDLAAHEETPQERVKLYQRYCLMNSLQRIRDVGHLTVKVYRAQGLAAADLGGKSDPFCVLELVNSRLQTQTEYKTLAPNWQKIFTFNVKDINSVLEITVYDEDRDHKVEFLGKVAIPLLRIRNGEKRWYALKDKKLRGRAKGSSPQILLELTVIWNIIRACVRTLNPREQKYMEPEIKFKRQVFLRNVFRLKAIILIFIEMGKYIQSCWEWESKMRSTVAFVIFVFGCYYFEPYMIPAAAILILLKYYLLFRDAGGLNQWVSGQVALITGTSLSHHTPSHLHDPSEGISDDCPITPGDDDDDDDDKDKEEKKSLKERLQAIQEVTQTVQNSIGYIASLCEKVKNLFNFTVPYLSYLAMLLAILGVAVLYFIPVRYLILAWGINKFSRKIVRPHSVPNNEVLDLISRVPDDEELLNYRELKPLPTTDCDKGGTGSPSTSHLTRREQRKRYKAA